MEMEEFYKFLSRKSVLGIINSLAKDKPLQFKDIKSGFNISDKTVFKTTSELLELNLVKKSIIIREGKHVDVYELTELGKEIHSLLDQINYAFKRKEKEEEEEEKAEEEVEEEGEEEGEKKAEEVEEEEERRELTIEEKEHIHIIIERIVNKKDVVIREMSMKELDRYIDSKLKGKTYWFKNKELSNFIFSTLSGKYPKIIVRRIFFTLNLLFDDIREDYKYQKKWVKKLFPILQKTVEDYSVDKEIRLEAIEIIDNIQDKDSNLLPEVLKYLFDLHYTYFNSEYFGSEEHGYFRLRQRLFEKRTKVDKEIIRNWIEEILEEPERYDVDRNLKDEYRKIYRKVS